VKVITSDNYLIRPFRANKTWIVPYTFLSSSNTNGIFIDVANSPPADWNTFISGTNVNSSGINKQTLYRSVQHSFYTASNPETTASMYSPMNSFGRDFYPTGSSFYVVNVAQQTFGEGIRKGSFRITTTNSTASIYDDSNGHIVSSTDPTKIIGNIFYSNGVIVIQQDTGSYSASLVTDKGLYLTTGSVVTVQLSGIHTIYEHQVICTVDPEEFNFSTNPTMRSVTLSGSLSGSTFTQQTGSVAVGLLFSGTLSPYFTTLGMYNDKQELVAIAKVPRPIHRISATQQTIIVRFDA
jgi:hypothetical protein